MSDHLVVVGASLAGLRAVETARELGHDGPITLIGDEPHLPYDRPPLSKEFLEYGPTSSHHELPGAERLTDDLDVTVRTGSGATGLDLDSRVVRLDDDTVPFDRLLVTTGVRPRTLPGQESLAGVHQLRTVDDARQIHAALERGARTVVVGGGFIGAEIASAAARRHLPTTVVEVATVPLVRAVGTSAGRSLSSLHARHGVELRCDVGVQQLVGDDHVRAVRLSDGTELAADLVIVGIGATPNTEWLSDSGLEVTDGLMCDETLRAGAGVWAAGDVARWHNPLFDRAMRLEHWTNAGEQAAHAVANMLRPDEATPYAHVPYFWSDWYGRRIQFAGLPVGEPQLVSGAWDGDDFVALFREGSRLVGVLTLDRRGDIMKYRALIGRRSTWEAALELADRRRAATAHATTATAS